MFETHVVCVMIPRLETVAVRDKMDNRALLHRKRRHRLTEENPRKVLAPGEKGFSGRKGRKACKHFHKGKCANPSCICLASSRIAIRDKKENSFLLHQKRRHRLTGRYPQESSGSRGESPSGTTGRIPCRNFLGEQCTYPSCKFWHPPVCLNYMSGSGMAKNADTR